VTSVGDSADVRAAKEEMLRLRKRIWPAIAIGAAILLIGFVATIAASFLELSEKQEANQPPEPMPLKRHGSS
jgi:hypothetical protein